MNMPAPTSEKITTRVKHNQESAWRRWAQLKDRLERQDLLIIDGATGTEIERRGGKMDNKGWSSCAQLTAPNIVQEVHEAYLKAGADIIIANTYATNRNVMNAAEFGADTQGAIWAALRLANVAGERFQSMRPAGPWIAGSLSTHPPAIPTGLEAGNDSCYPPAMKEEEAYIEAAESMIQGDPSCDMLWLEMMQNRDHAPRAIRAAAGCGLPIFLGISTRITSDGQIYLRGSDESESGPTLFTREVFREFLELAGKNLVGINIMHTNFSAMLPTLRLVREFGWDGPLGAYPDHGHFTMPHWVFAEIQMGDAMELVKTWIDESGVQLVGGCCGLGPEFIEGLVKLRNSLKG